MADKQLKIRVSADDAASPVFKKLEANAERLQKRLVGFGKLGGVRGLEAFESAGAIGKGGFALAATAFATRQVSNMAQEAERLATAYRLGEQEAGDLFETIAGGIPILGDAWKAGRALREVITGEDAEIEKINRTAAVYEQFNQTLADMKKNADAARVALDGMAKRSFDSAEVMRAAPGAERAGVVAGQKFDDRLSEIEARMKQATAQLDGEIAAHKDRLSKTTNLLTQADIRNQIVVLEDRRAKLLKDLEPSRRNAIAGLLEDRNAEFKDGRRTADSNAVSAMERLNAFNDGTRADLRISELEAKGQRYQAEVEGVKRRFDEERRRVDDAIADIKRSAPGDVGVAGQADLTAGKLKAELARQEREQLERMQQDMTRSGWKRLRELWDGPKPGPSEYRPFVTDFGQNDWQNASPQRLYEMSQMSNPQRDTNDQKANEATVAIEKGLQEFKGWVQENIPGLFRDLMNSGTQSIPR